METESIIIRRAQGKDSREIWRLLHSEGRHVSIKEITEKPEHYYVLLHGTKLLGVFADRDRAGQNRWVEVHPLYPQKLVEDVMVKVVNGLFYRTLI